MEQLSPEWFQAKIGKVGASHINDILAKNKNGGEPASRRNYRMELVIARLTGEYPDTYCSPAMQWGIDHEPAARSAYEFISGNVVQKVGFIEHPSIPMSGASPDGLIGEEGCIEIKCPVTANHVDILLAGKVPTDYQNQMLWQMEVTGRKWCDFVSYDPRMPFELQLFYKRFERDDERIEVIKVEVVKFLAEVDDMVAKLKEARAV